MAFSVCPKCGSRNLRISRVRSFAERLRTVAGIFPFRCRQCDTRFPAAIWSLSAWRYARCPKCLRMELSTWSEQYYHPPLGTVVKLRLGATPYRCEFCRCNFASYRACKERFSWRKRPTVDKTEVEKQVKAE